MSFIVSWKKYQGPYSILKYFPFEFFNADNSTMFLIC